MNIGLHFSLFGIALFFALVVVALSHGVATGRIPARSVLWFGSASFVLYLGSCAIDAWATSCSFFGLVTFQDAFASCRNTLSVPLHGEIFFAGSSLAFVVLGVISVVGMLVRRNHRR